MLSKIKNIIPKIDLLLYKKFGSHKSIKVLENIKEAKLIFSFLNEAGEDTKTRFVGGCIRKAFAGEKIDDIDLATSLEPEEVNYRLRSNGVKTIDTGITHGTVTAILNKKKFEITTLRKDISTDGRHAKVTFTLNWEQDALRRDFTINAIYADIEGRIYDPLDGLSDLKKGKIKFIGSSEERIKEDYLRILRYLRFFVQYSKEDHDHNTTSSIKKNINGINKISNERIFDELKKILKLKNFHSLFDKDYLKEIFLNIFPQFKYYERLKTIYSLHKSIQDQIDVDLMLALLVVDQSNDYEYFCHKYKTSNNIKNRFKNISQHYEELKNKKFYSQENIKKLIYLSSKEEVIDLLLFSACSNKKMKNLNIEELLIFVMNYKIPKFPISGDYLKQLGYEKGKILGDKLRLLENKWIQNNFFIDEKIIKKYLGKVNDG
tara:strand:+ start:41 stop:1339 length:1299 start_codon:yes stop_codon:yes gene_type:complete